MHLNTALILRLVNGLPSYFHALNQIPLLKLYISWYGFLMILLSFEFDWVFWYIELLFIEIYESFIKQILTSLQQAFIHIYRLVWSKEFLCVYFHVKIMLFLLLLLCLSSHWMIEAIVNSVRIEVLNFIIDNTKLVHKIILSCLFCIFAFWIISLAIRFIFREEKWH